MHHRQHRASREANRHQYRLLPRPGRKKPDRQRLQGRLGLPPDKELQQPATRRRGAWQTPFPSQPASLHQEFPDTDRSAGRRWQRPPDRFGKQPSHCRGQLPRVFQYRRLAHKQPASPDRFALSGGSRAATEAAAPPSPTRSGYANIPKESPPWSSRRARAGLGNAERATRPASSVRQPFSGHRVAPHRTMKRPGQPQGHGADHEQPWRQESAQPHPQARRQNSSAEPMLKTTQRRGFHHATAILREGLVRHTLPKNRRRTPRLTPPLLPLRQQKNGVKAYQPRANLAESDAAQPGAVPNSPRRQVPARYRPTQPGGLHQIYSQVALYRAGPA